MNQRPLAPRVNFMPEFRFGPEMARRRDEFGAWLERFLIERGHICVTEKGVRELLPRKKDERIRTNRAWKGGLLALDTCAWIDCLYGRNGVRRFVEQPAILLATSVVTLEEAERVFMKHRQPPERMVEFLETIKRSSKILDVSWAVESRLKRFQKSSGLCKDDALIYLSAIDRGAQLLTSDRRVGRLSGTIRYDNQAVDAARAEAERRIAEGKKEELFGMGYISAIPSKFRWSERDDRIAAVRKLVEISGKDPADITDFEFIFFHIGEMIFRDGPAQRLIAEAGF